MAKLKEEPVKAEEPVKVEEPAKVEEPVKAEEPDPRDEKIAQLEREIADLKESYIKTFMRGQNPPEDKKDSNYYLKEMSEVYFNG